MLLIFKDDEDSLLNEKFECFKAVEKIVVYEKEKRFDAIELNNVANTTN